MTNHKIKYLRFILPNQFAFLFRGLFILMFFVTFFSNGQENNRIQNLKNNLDLLAVENSELNENLKLEINVSNITLSNFLLAVSRVHQLNLTVTPDVGKTSIINNFSNVTVSDLLIFLCKEYDLTIEFTGNILSVKKFIPEVLVPEEKEILIHYESVDNLISLDLKNDPLEKVFRKIMDVSGSNMLYSSDLQSRSINLYLSKVPLDIAMEKLASTNRMTFSKSKDGFYLFDTLLDDSINNVSMRHRLGGNETGYQILDTIRRMLNVNFKNSSIASIIDNLKQDLKLDVYVATPIEQAGNVTFNAKNISFDALLGHVFKGQSGAITTIVATNSQNNRNKEGYSQKGNNPIKDKVANTFTFKKEGDIYFFGTTDQLSLRKVEVVQMMHRSIELLSDPGGSKNRSRRSVGRTDGGNVNYFGNNQNNQNSNYQNNSLGLGNSRRSLNSQSQSFDSYQNSGEAILSILPDELRADLDIKIDYELNSFYVNGPSTSIERFKDFIKEIDKPVPVVLIEVMIIEVKKSASVETGISWGIGEESVKTQGKLFPSTDVTLGAKTVNKIIGGFDGFGSFNIGKVVPEFFANIKAMEASGNIKIRSTPKLSTLNGHRANLSIGETTYYVVTNQNFFGSQIPTSSEVRNYQPIDAELAISIKPLVSGDGQVTLDINVIQSDFSGERIEEDAPPGLTSREFSSIIRMQNQDLAILGGLEEKLKNDSGNGVPLLARIPVIKWLFSKRKREDNKQKLTILVKPTVIY